MSVIDPTGSLEARLLNLRDEVRRRRSFAIISHPDAGKTTLTEKLLLFSGAVHAAGSVRPKKNRGHATSDWMEMEQARGISITSTVLQFEHDGCLFNLLDTPGHQDFSEDTYRTLTAADSAVMVLDAAKGIEAQTKKLFAVCRMRQTPILTFINKLDMPGLEPLELLDEIERILGVAACPVNWPVGYGGQFRGVVDRATRTLVEYHGGAGGALRPGAELVAVDSPAFDAEVGPALASKVRDELDLLEGATPRFDPEAFRAGTQTPVYFGSALKNFGIDRLLEALVHLAPSPLPRRCLTNGPVIPDKPGFSAFVFKIQGNMDPNHRDTMAVLRICSGRFERDMLVHHARLGKKFRMTRLHRLFARDRETVDEAFAGDVVGVVNPGMFLIGDTLSAEPGIEYDKIPSFEPEHFAVLRCEDMARNKQFRKGVTQLAEEGIVQVYHAIHSGRREPILGAVGRLQFDVVESRMWQEYGARVKAIPVDYFCARWLLADAARLAKVKWPSTGVTLAEDQHGAPVCLFNSKWDLSMLSRENPDIQLSVTGAHAQSRE